VSKWWVYKIGNLSTEGWRAHGISREPITSSKDIHILARALVILEKAEAGVEWLNDAHEYWITPCPLLPPIICVRPRSNPYESGYIVSPLPLPHLDFPSQQMEFPSKEVTL
jgi:hypothetical protein